MKIFKYFIIAIVAVAISFTSCKTGKTDIGSGLVKYIPDSAIFVSSIKAKQLVDKGGLADYKNFNFYKLLNKELLNDNEKIAAIFNNFISDTRSSGLNLDHFYVYSVKKASSYLNIFLMFNVDDIKVFENVLKQLIETNNLDNEPVDKVRYKEFELSYNSKILWNKDMLYIVADNTPYYHLKKEETDYSFLFTENSKNITSNEDFVAFNKKQHDMGYWMSYKYFTSLISGMSRAIYSSDLESSMLYGFEDLNLHMLVNFENGDAKLTGTITPKDKVESLLKEYPIFDTNFDEDLLKYFPEKSCTVMKGSLNIQAYVDMIKDKISKYLEVQGEDSDNYYLTAFFDNYLELFNRDEFKVITSGLTGDAVFSIYDFQQGFIPLPLASLIFNVKDEETFSKIVSLFPQSLLKKQSKYYTIMSGPMVWGYVAYKDNKVYVTNDEKAIDAFLDKGFEKNLLNSSYAKDLKSNFCWLLNLDLDSYPDHIKLLLRNYIGRSYDYFQSFIGIYKSASYKSTGDFGFEAILTMKNKNANSLKVFLKNLDENILEIIN